MASILLVEDDPITAEGIVQLLQRQDHAVTRVDTIREGLERVHAASFAMAIVDRTLPDGDGLSLVSEVRERGDAIPILMLSALGQADDRIAGLRAGGDDYLVKPFVPGELSARVDALLRRVGVSVAAPTVFTEGPITLDLLRREVRRRETLLDLSPTEFRILECLIRHAGDTVTRTMLFEFVWGYRFDPGTNVINVHIRALRKKLEQSGDPDLIHTVKGAGYRLQDPLGQGRV
jgi:two-component system OmpR family response regulator